MDKIIFEDMPGRVKGFTIENDDGSYTVCINSKLNFEQQKEVYEHEARHVVNGDFDSDRSVDIIEFLAHQQ